MKYIILSIFMVFSCSSLLAQSVEIKKEILDSGTYCYSLKEHYTFYEDQKTNIDLDKSNETISKEYKKELFAYISANIDINQWPYTDSTFSFTVLLNNSGKVVYVDVFSEIDLANYNQLIQWIDYLCKWHKPFTKTISTDSNTLYMLGWSAYDFEQ